MRDLIAAAAVAVATLIAMLPAEAKSIWLKCGDQVINLDGAKERFSLTSGKIIYQGRATFSPRQIDFEYQLLDLPGGGGVKNVYSVDRKSLNYTETGFVSFTNNGWIRAESTSKSPNPTFGKCSVMKTPPTTGNQI